MDREALTAANKNPSPVPMTDAELDALRVPKWRDSRDELLPLPPGIRLILSIDRDFRTWDTPMFAEALSGDDDVLVTSSGSAWMRSSMLGQYMTEVEGDIWHDTKMPALVPVFSPGDQGVFVYIGEADDGGCYPVFRYDDEPCGWISAANVIEHTLDRNDKERIKAAEERNAHFTEQEWWADTPAMQQFWSLMEGS